MIEHVTVPTPNSIRLETVQTQARKINELVDAMNLLLVSHPLTGRKFRSSRDTIPTSADDASDREPPGSTDGVR